MHCKPSPVFTRVVNQGDLISRPWTILHAKDYRAPLIVGHSDKRFRVFAQQQYEGCMPLAMKIRSRRRVSIDAIKVGTGTDLLLPAFYPDSVQWLSCVTEA